jgi:primosomal protein N' (replication factor Y)
MFIIEVIPLVKIASLNSQTLTYFSSQKPEIGGLVLVSLGKADIKAIIKSVEPLENIKIQIKKDYFKLKPISKIISDGPIINQSQMELCQWLSDYYISPIGIALKLFLPKNILKSKKPSSQKISINPVVIGNKNKKSFPVLFYSEDRTKKYLEIIKKTVKENKQVLFLVPEINQISKYLPYLEKISEKTIVFQSDIKSSQEKKYWQGINQGKIDIIIGTRTSLFLPFNNLGLIILDEEENESYKSWDQHPKYHTRTVALKLAEILNSEIILGSRTPSLESMLRAQEGKYEFLGQAKKQKPDLNISIVDMKEEIRKSNFSIFSEELQKKLIKTISDNKKAILFINRKGSATAVLCRDCGHIIKCQDCDSPMVYHKTLGSRSDLLACHYCGKTMTPPATCPKCKSWRIKYVGSGTQKAIEELKKIGKDKINPVIIDSDTAPTKKEQEQIEQDFAKGKYNVLIGTQLLFSLNLAPEDISLAVIVLADPLFNMPEYRSPERLAQIIRKISFLAKETLIQTYNPDLHLFNFLNNNNFDDFIEEEIKHRKSLFYPPFSEIIKLTFSHKNLDVAKRESIELKRKIQKAIPDIKILGPVPALMPKIKNKYFWHLIVKIKPESSAEKKIIQGLISPDWSVDVEPLSLL